ncbi:MAG: RsmF rRNA methyltransferase first C-terminal domain-containing protein, partial [Clostridia bacterium]|nr:RsmF rRNA methyltransferase first C-terminal domain-containing protein [Clostridia bacterium]
MFKVPEAFAKHSLTALPPPERTILIQVMEQGIPYRAIRMRPGKHADKTADVVPWAQDAYYIDANSNAGGSPLHDAGAYYLQEPSAMAAATALDIVPGQRVLDLCAAPGGKSTQIAAMLAGKGLIVANDVHPSRARVLAQNVERMGISNAIVTNARPEALAAKWGPCFDRVLVDAPCSGEGMFRKESGSLAQWTSATVDGCAARQRMLLKSAAALVAEGGLLVYSTCTFNEWENERTVEYFLADRYDFMPENFTLSGVGMSQSGCLRLWPHRLRGEGHFIARLRKRGRPAAYTPLPPTYAFSSLFPGFIEWTMSGIPQQSGDTTWLLPAMTPTLDGIRALRTGLCMAARKGRFVLPDHALSHALPPSAFA